VSSALCPPAHATSSAARCGAAGGGAEGRTSHGNLVKLVRRKQPRLVATSSQWSRELDAKCVPFTGVFIHGYDHEARVYQASQRRRSLSRGGGPPSSSSRASSRKRQSRRGKEARDVCAWPFREGPWPQQRRARAFRPAEVEIFCSREGSGGPQYLRCPSRDRLSSKRTSLRSELATAVGRVNEAVVLGPRPSTFASTLGATAGATAVSLKTRSRRAGSAMRFP